MQYIHLNDDSYILHTSKGMTTLNRKTFNFHTIKNLIKKGAEEAQILPLLETPKLPDGLFELFIHEEEDKPAVLSVKNTKSDGNPVWGPLGGTGLCHPYEDDSDYLGMYACEADMISDWPEYCL